MFGKGALSHDACTLAVSLSVHAMLHIWTVVLFLGYKPSSFHALDALLMQTGMNLNQLAIAHTRETYEPAATLSPILQHPLHLQSAYMEVTGAEPDFTSSHDRFHGTVDYIWYTPQVRLAKLHCNNHVQHLCLTDRTVAICVQAQLILMQVQGSCNIGCYAAGSQCHCDTPVCSGPTTTACCRQWPANK